MSRLTVLLWLSYAACLHAQAPPLQSISIEQGLSQGFVSAICQDDDGFLWFGTQNGLNRYDGYGFKVFRNNPFDPWSLPDNEIVRMAAAADFLLLETANREHLFHRKTHRLLPVPHIRSETRLHSVIAFKPNALWVARWGRTTEGLSELLCVQWPADLFERLDKGQAPDELFVLKRHIPLPDFSYPALSDDDKHCWFIDGEYLSVLELASGKKRSFPLPPLLKRTQAQALHILPGKGGIAWIYHMGQLARFDGQSWQLFSLPLMPALLWLDRKNELLWFKTHPGVFCIDLKRQPFDPGPVHTLVVPEGVQCGFTDRRNNVWIGTNAQGIRKYTPLPDFFQNYLTGISIMCTPVDNGRGKVLLTDLRRRGPGCGILDRASGQFTDAQQLRLPLLSGASACADEEGGFWIAGKEEGQSAAFQLYHLDPDKGLQGRYPLPASFSGNLILVRKTGPAEIWLLNNQNLARFDPVARTFKVFQSLGSGPQAWIFAAERDSGGVWWLATSAGLLQAVPEGANAFRFSTWVNDPQNRNSLPSNYIKSLLPDPADPQVLWLGSNGQGISRFDTKKRQFTHFNTQNGLPDDVVYGILADDEKPHNLWISTNRGLARFNPQTFHFQCFLRTDGLPDNEFNTFASYKRPDGEMLFGGVNGLTAFHPKNLTAGQPAPEVRLTDVMINGQRLSPRDSGALISQDISFLERLELSYDQHNLQLFFAAMDFSSPARNRFAYYLEGAETPWVHQGFEHSAQYLNLAPGKYAFHLKAANNTGAWSEQAWVLKIVVHPPWYRSWWAYLVYVCLLAGAVVTLYKAQLRSRLEQAEAERLKSLDAFKSRFFTNITHEFRTPLTVILGISEKLSSEIGKWESAAPGPGHAGAPNPDFQSLRSRISLIRRNGQSLLRLINQLLDLAKLESHTLKMSYVQGDVLAYLRYINESLHSLADARDLRLRVESPEAEIVMDYDSDRLLQIVHNLLSNAIKFTPAGGQVLLEVVQDAGSLQFRVSDTGLGIAPEAMPHIFDRFYQAGNLQDGSAGGTGIGLALTRELVKAMGGQIHVQSEAGKGTAFTVRLPMHHRAVMMPATVVAEPAVPLSRPQHTGFSAQASLLVIEDNPDVAEYLRACLAAHYALDFAYNGQEGIKKALENMPDLIVSDVMMPEKDGFEVLEVLKNDLRSSHIPVVLLTAKADVDSRMAGLRRGADAYLAKPFHEEELLLTLENLLAGRRKLQEKYQNDAFHKPQAVPAETADPEDAFLQKARDCVLSHLSNSTFSVDVLCRDLGMSQPQLHRKLTALTGKNATLFIRSIRLAKARELLLGGGKNVSEVAYEVGFPDPKYFSRVFSEEYGLPPSKL